MAGARDSLKDKQQVVEMEVDDVKNDISESDMEPVSSAFAGWTRSAMVKKFWRLYLTGLIVSIGGMYVLCSISPATAQCVSSMQVC